MPLSNDLSNYPIQEYMILFKAAAKRGTLEVPAESYRAARRIRHEMHHVMQVMRREPMYFTREPYASFLAVITATPVMVQVKDITQKPGLVLSRKGQGLSPLVLELLEQDPSLGLQVTADRGPQDQSTPDTQDTQDTTPITVASYLRGMYDDDK